MWQLDRTFAHEYECEVQPNLDGREGKRYYFPGATSSGGQDGITVRVVPHQAEPWIGTFAFGKIVPNGLSGVFTTPNTKRLLVVAKGDGYLITTDNPEQWERVATIPTTDVRSIEKQEIMVLASFTNLVAYNHAGVFWKTKQLSWDNLKIVSVTELELTGEFWDIRTESKQRFIVDLKTGTASGGAVLPEMKLSRQE
jgi:hypothetical protein